MPPSDSHGHSHGHSHGPDPDAPPPTEEVRGLRRRAVWLMLLFLVPVMLATVVGLFVLWPGGGPTRAQQAADVQMPPGTTYPHGRVVSVAKVACGSEKPGEPPQCANAVMEVLDGAGKGDFQKIQLSPDIVAAGVHKGDVFVLNRDPGAEGGPAYGFSDYARGTPIVVLAIAFAVVVGL